MDRASAPGVFSRSERSINYREGKNLDPSSEDLTWQQVIDWFVENQSKLSEDRKVLKELAEFFDAEAGATREDTAANIVQTIKDENKDLSESSSWNTNALSMYTKGITK